MYAIELIEQKRPTLEKSINTVLEMMKKKMVNTQFVEEEIIIDVKYMEKNVDNMMIIDSGAPVSIVSAAWFDEYVKDAKVDNDEIKKKNCARRFRLGKTLYISEV